MKLPESRELIAIIRADVEVYRVATQRSVGAAGELMKTRCAEPDVENFTLPDYWRRLVEEIRVLLCTEDERYKDVREKMSGTRPTANIAVSMIAAAIGAYVGIEPALLVPFVALALAMASRLSLEAWCATASHPGFEARPLEDPNNGGVNERVNGEESEGGEGAEVE